MLNPYTICRLPIPHPPIADRRLSIPHRPIAVRHLSIPHRPIADRHLSIHPFRDRHLSIPHRLIADRHLTIPRYCDRHLSIPHPAIAIYRSSTHRSWNSSLDASSQSLAQPQYFFLSTFTFSLFTFSLPQCRTSRGLRRWRWDWWRDNRATTRNSLPLDRLNPNLQKRSLFYGLYAAFLLDLA